MSFPVVRGWRSVFPGRRLAALLVAYALLSVATEAYSRALPLLVRAVGVPVAALGLAESLAAGAEAVVSTPLGVLADRVDRPTVAGLAGLGLAALLTVLGTVGLTSSLGLVAIVVAIAVVRLAFSNSVTPLVESTLGDQSGTGWGFYGAAVYLGGAVGLGLASVVIGPTLTLPVRFVFLAVVPALVAAVVALWWECPPVRPTVGAPDWTEWAGVPRLDPLGAIRQISRPRALVGICAADAVVTVATSGSLFLLPLLAVDIGLRADIFLLGLGSSFLAGAALSLIGGWLADRVHSKVVYVTNFVAETAMLAAFALADGAMLFAIGIGLYTVQTAFESGYIDYFFSLFTDDEAGRVWGINGTVNKVAGAIGPAGGGILYGLDPHLPFAVGAALLATGTAIAWTLPAE
ncbi:MAG: MFS transporter [Halobacteriaceae archaeon]